MKRKEFYIQEELKDHIVKFRVDSEVAYFVNLGDIHWGSCNRELFEKTFKFFMSIPNLYVGIGGDAGNGATKLGKSDVTEVCLPRAKDRDCAFCFLVRYSEIVTDCIRS